MSPWRKQALSSQLLVKGMGRWRARDEPRCWSTSEEDLVWNPEGNRTSRSQVGGGEGKKGRSAELVGVRIGIGAVPGRLVREGEKTGLDLKLGNKTQKAHWSETSDSGGTGLDVSCRLECVLLHE